MYTFGFQNNYCYFQNTVCCLLKGKLKILNCFKFAFKPFPNELEPKKNDIRKQSSNSFQNVSSKQIYFN